MLFNSLKFIVFFPSVVLLFFLIPHRFRWLFLLIASYYFYMSWKPVYALLIFTSTTITWLCGILIEKSKENVKKRLFLITSLIINFSILILYKYFNFLNESIKSTLDYLNIGWDVPNLDLLLPVGISFYTFQAVGYTIDVYRGNIKAENHFGIYALFVSFFPQLVAGPIERASNLLPQFREVKKFSYDNFILGTRMMFWGFFLKIVLADRLASYVNAVFNNAESHNGSSHLLASFLFSFQIYGDFAGYSLIAIGVAKILDFRLMTNFNRPYFSTNVTTFWSRWHISLSTWFKDYLYIPMGGSKVSNSRHYFNIFVTFFVSGIWHGANFTFMVWGALHGFFLMIEKRIGIYKMKDNFKFSIKNTFNLFITFLLVTLAWIFFRANSLGDAIYILKSIFTNLNSPLFIKWDVFFAASIALMIVIIKEIVDETLLSRFEKLCARNFLIRPVLLAFLFAGIILFGVFDSGQFIYFQF